MFRSSLRVSRVDRIRNERINKLVNRGAEGCHERDVLNG